MNVSLPGIQRHGGSSRDGGGGRGANTQRSYCRSVHHSTSSLTCCHSRPWGPGVCFPDYSHGITLVTPLSGSEKKQVLHFCALGSDEMQKFVEDLKESVAEVTELEQIRIECKAAVRLVAGWAGGLPVQQGGAAACSGLE